MSVKMTLEFDLGSNYDTPLMHELLSTATKLAIGSEPAKSEREVGSHPALGLGYQGSSDTAVHPGAPPSYVPPTPSAEQVASEEAEEAGADEADQTPDADGTPKRRRRTKAQIEADRLADQQRTMQAAHAGGLLPPTLSSAPAQPPALPPTAHVVAVPPTSPVAVPPAPPVAIPPTVQPQAPAMPVQPTADLNEPNITNLRELQRQMNSTVPGVSFRVMKSMVRNDGSVGYYRPEDIETDGRIEEAMFVLKEEWRKAMVAKGTPLPT